jgi:hypothetical protein
MALDRLESVVVAIARPRRRHHHDAVDARLSISGTSFSMVNGSGICGFTPGTHFQSSVSAFHRCTWASTMVRLAGCAPDFCTANVAPVASAEPRSCRRESMNVSSS